MPLYEYACEECGRETELLVTPSAQPACPECGSSKMSKLLSIVAAPCEARRLATGPICRPVRAEPIADASRKADPVRYCGSYHI